ncbi:MAG: hypothetical protein JWR26_1769 [Pedosphaera sp.]|nr:hypothetical protein [Pedosphaera sp.]
MLPSVISNRLFVYAETPFGNEKRNILMSDDLDSQLPRLWDRNYNSNKFEIVNEFTNPVFQVIYKKPNEIQVNGIFFVNSNSVYVSFGGAPVLLTMTGFKVMDLKTMQETNVPSIPEALGVSTMGEVITNAFYNLQFTDQKAIFQYPSNRHPGGLAQ